MKNQFLYLFLFFSIMTLSSCTRWFSVSPEFEKLSIDHKTIAVLPFEVVMRGRQPKNITPEQIAAIEAAEGLAFQISMHDEILRSLNNGRFNLSVDLLSVRETNARITNAGLELSETHQMSPKKLCELLEVDALYLGRVEKNRFLTDLESFGIDLAGELLFTLTRDIFWPFTDPSAQDIFVRGSIVEGNHGQALFTAVRNFNVDWTNPSQQIVRNINARIARRIPYREKNRNN